MSWLTIDVFDYFFLLKLNDVKWNGRLSLNPSWNLHQTNYIHHKLWSLVITLQDFILLLSLIFGNNILKLFIFLYRTRMVWFAMSFIIGRSSATVMSFCCLGFDCGLIPPTCIGLNLECPFPVVWLCYAWHGIKCVWCILKFI